MSKRKVMTYEELVREYGEENVLPDFRLEPETESDRALDAYYDHFGECFPSIPLRWGRTDEEVIEMIDQCLAEDKDVYEMGILPEPSADLAY